MNSKNWGIELGKILKSQASSNISGSLGASIGDVLSLSPFKVGLFGGQIIISSDIHTIYIGDKIEADIGEHELDYDLLSELKVGDKVGVIADETNQEFFIINRMKKVGG